MIQWHKISEAPPTWEAITPIGLFRILQDRSKYWAFRYIHGVEKFVLHSTIQPI